MSTDAPAPELVAWQRLLQGVVSADDAKRAVPAGNALPHEIAPEERAAFASSDPRRALVYRKLIRRTIADAVRREIPRAAARRGASYSRDLSRFCNQVLPRSQILRDVAYELTAWVADSWRQDPEAPPFLCDLARYELLEFDVHAAQRRLPDSPPVDTDGGLDAALSVAFDGSVRLGRFSYAVHELPDDENDRSEPEEREVMLLAYRDDDAQLRVMSLTPLAAAIIERLAFGGEALGAAITGASAAIGQAVDSEVVEGSATVLADLAERGVVLGAQPVGEPLARSPWANWLVAADFDKQPIK